MAIHGRQKAQIASGGSSMRDLPTLQSARVVLCALLFTHPMVAGAQQNLGFEASNAGTLDSWRVRGGATDTSVRSEGNTSLRLASTGSQLPPGTVTAIASQTVSRDAFVGDRIRLAADIRTDSIDPGYAGIWLRIEGPQGFLHIDDMRNKPVSGTQDWSRHEIQLAVPPETTGVMFGAHISGNGTAWFDDLTIESYSSSSLPPPSEEVTVYMNDVLDIMQEHSIVTESVSWDSFRESALNAVRGMKAIDETHTTVTILLRRLGDNHSGFISPEMASRLQGSEPADLGPWVSPRSQVFDERLGYIMVPGFVGSDEQRETRFADEIQSAIRDIDASTTCGWIVDLRSNTGGNMWPMLAGLGPLLDEGNLGSLRRNDGTQEHWWYRPGESGLGNQVGTTASISHDRDTARSPVAVLVGPFTASSGEAVALSFLGAADTRLFGLKTRGQTTGNEPFTLSDGAMLNLATSAMTDRFGQAYPQGIEPHVVVEEPPGTRPLDEQATVEAAVEWLGRFDTCHRDP
jgi:hypothetical protein